MILTGLVRLGRNAELRNTPGGDAVANLALAYNYGKKEGGKQPSQWIDASLWGKRAESLAQYLVKGQQLVVTVGDVYVREYKKKDGSTGTSLCGRVIELEFAGSPPAKVEPKPEPKPTPRVDDIENGFDDSDIPF